MALTMDSRQPLLKGRKDMGRPWELSLGNGTCTGPRCLLEER